MAQFNYNSKCAHPKIVKHLMTDFLQSASTLDYPVVLVRGRKGNGFNIFLGELDEDIVKIEYDFSSLSNAEWDIANTEFMRCAHRLSKGLTKGFSALTISLLHELGHSETFYDIPDDYDRVAEVFKCHEDAGLDERLLNRLYFELVDEKMATEWAINWLSNAENRRKAKAFEKAFFKAWRG